MSTSESPNRSPMEEIAKRVSEAGAGLVAAAKATAVQNLVANQSAHRRRVEDSHRLGMQTLGMMEESDFAKPGDEDVGNIIVTGDVYGDEAVKMLGTGQVPATTVPPSLLARAAPLLLAGALGASGVGVPWLVASLAAKPAVEAAEVIDTDTHLEWMIDLVPME